MTTSIELKTPQRWPDVVHEQRKAASISQARTEFRLKKRGRPMEVKANAKVPVLLCVAGVVSSLALWRREGEWLRATDLRTLPGVGFVLSLLDNGPRQPTVARGQIKARAVAAPGAAAAARSGSGSNLAQAASSSATDQQVR